MPPPRKARPSAALVRALSKRGICSRSEAFELVRAGRVRVNGRIAQDPLGAVPDGARIEIDGAAAAAHRPVYVMLNKPRGLLTTSSDEQGRDTVFSCLANAPLPRVVAVGRLDKASEGLLLLTNDTAWANAITDPATRIEKTYHVQIDTMADDALLQAISIGVHHQGEPLRVKRAKRLRSGDKNSWLEIVLDEGRNRHIRRLLEALGVNVLRLIRVAIGPLQLGELPKGQWRHLTAFEARSLHPC